MTNEELSRRFWKKIIGLIDVAVMILMGVVAYFIGRVSMQLGIGIGSVVGPILSIVIIAGPMSYVDHILNKELDRRFPPFDKSGDSIQRIRSEVNYNYQRKD